MMKLKNWILLWAVVFLAACKGELDIGVVSANKLKGQVKEIFLSGPQGDLMYKMEYSATDQKWTGFTVSEGLGKPGTTYIAEADTSGKILKLRSGDGKETRNYTYNIQGRLTEVKSTLPDGSVVLEKLNYNAGQLEYYTRQLTRGGSSTYAETKSYRKLSANAITVITSRPGQGYEEEDFFYEAATSNVLTGLFSKLGVTPVEGFLVVPGKPVKSERIFEGCFFNYAFKNDGEGRPVEFGAVKSFDLSEWKDDLKYIITYHQ